MKVTKTSDMSPYMGVAKKLSVASNCMKMRVGCVIADSYNILASGWNDAVPSAMVCPRMHLESGFGYTVCEDFCNQQFHAETMALSKLAEVMPTGDRVAYLYGHDHMCEDCEAQMEKYGIREVFIYERQEQ